MIDNVDGVCRCIDNLIYVVVPQSLNQPTHGDDSGGGKDSTLEVGDGGGVEVMIVDKGATKEHGQENSKDKAG
jgi:hypothetical protein